MSALSASPRLGFTPEEAAASLGVSRESFDRHVKPSIRVVRVGSRVVVPVRELERWLDRNASVLLDGEVLR